MPDHPIKLIQQVLTMDTQGGTLRSGAYDWIAEDPRGAHPTKPVGICGSMWHEPGQHNLTRRSRNGSYSYPDPLRALADGWRLLGPPSFTPDNEVPLSHEWWFVREVPEDG